MLRRAFKCFAVLSLLICLAISVLWARSYFVSYTISYFTTIDPRKNNGCTKIENFIGVSRGSVMCGRAREMPRIANAQRWQLYRSAVEEDQDVEIVRFGGILRFESNPVYTVFPAWIPVSLPAIAPAMLLLNGLRRRRRLGAGRCKSCGYDLRASPSRCPECGTPTVRPNSPARRGRRRK